MYTTPYQCAMALKSNMVRVVGINDTVLCYNGESFVIRKNKSCYMSENWEGFDMHHVQVDSAFVDDGNLYIMLGDVDDNTELFTGKLMDLNKVISSTVRMEWNVGVEFGKWLYDDPVIKGMIIYGTNNMYVY